MTKVIETRPRARHTKHFDTKKVCVYEWVFLFCIEAGKIDENDDANEREKSVFVTLLLSFVFIELFYFSFCMFSLQFINILFQFLCFSFRL